MTVINWEGSNKLRFMSDLACLAYSIDTDEIDYTTTEFTNNQNLKFVWVTYEKDLHNRYGYHGHASRYPLRNLAALRALVFSKGTVGSFDNVHIKLNPTGNIISIPKELVCNGCDGATMFEIVCNENIAPPSIDFKGIRIGDAVKTATGYCYPLYSYEICMSMLNWSGSRSEDVFLITDLVPNEKYIFMFNRIYLTPEWRRDLAYNTHAGSPVFLK